MRNLLLFVCLFELLAAQTDDVDCYTYCESCLTTAQEIESILKKYTAESRRDVVEKLVSGAVCGTAPFHKNGQLSKENMKTSCKYLFDVHHEEFRTALLGREAERLDIAL
ncbi:hypothetical protein J4Q44_G00179510 [Coregonus suidteri]|uniref:Saposin B-type domain-containing protein n=1 Tax=Coregonus suidteri TaxID=861788 RepID=A0AAN8LH65_9TELE